jgi:hypothetical protein
MKTNLPDRCLFAVTVGVTIATAQNPTPAVSPAITEDALKFLSAPVWYLNYTVTETLNGTYASRNTSSERVMTGRMLLGLRSQGPSLSLITGDAKPPDLISQMAAQQAQALAGAGGNLQAGLGAVSQQLGSVTSAQVDQATAQLDAYINNWANWISGLNIDETKTDAENERDLIQVREQNIKVTERYRWQFSGPSSAGGHDRGSAHGAGTTRYGQEPAFEIDGANRKFKLLFPPSFSDSLQTVEAFQGSTEHNIGTIHYQRFDIKAGLHSGEQPITKITPEHKFIEGSLPASFGNISGQSIHSIVKDGLPGTLSVQYVISPNPPIPVELWIDPPANYQRWQPTADEDEKTAGDVIPIKIVLQKPGGGAPQFKPMRYEFFLLDTSREKGVCLNWPPLPAAGAPGANDPPPFDLQFEADKNPDMYVRDEGVRLVETIPTQLEREVKVSCFDYGAYGEFAVHAVLENGQLVEGIVRGTTDQKRLKLPDCKDGSKIATAFLDDNGLSNVSDVDDEENDPVGDGYKGDGFTLYEEYRGFKNGNEWMSADPKKKDVFVINEIPGRWWVIQGIAAFEQATKLKVHRLVRHNQVTADGVINFSRTDRPHAVDQHAIWIKSGIAGTDFANSVDVGTPGKARGFQIPPDVAHRRGRTFALNTVAHELLHCCNIYHHGQGDKVLTWYYQPPTEQMFEASPTSGPGVPITLKLENGTLAMPSRCFPPGETTGQFDIGVARGEHSGNESCPMRYNISFAYRSTADPTVYYLTLGEPSGMVLCGSPAGTGVNASGRSPQSRYGPAAVPTPRGAVPEIKKARGDCLHQLRVNDKPPQPGER